jgi:hypothetical protein
MQLKQSRRFLLIGNLLLPTLLGLGAIGWTPTPAHACGNVAQGAAEGAAEAAVARSFSFKNGLRLGTQEAMVLKTFGPPTEQLNAGVRCHKPQVSFVYPTDTVVVLDRTAINPPVGRIRYMPPHSQPQLDRDPPGQSPDTSSTRVIVQFSTQNPELRLSSGIHVGDRLDQVIKVYGQPQSQYSQPGLTIISYQQGNEVLRFRLKDDRIESLDLMLNNHDRLVSYRARLASTKTKTSVHSTIAP